MCAHFGRFCAIYLAVCAKSSTFAPDFKRISLLHIIYYMALKIVVLAKQVPDTRNVGKDAMTAPSLEGAEPRLNSRNPHDGSSTCR